MLTVLAAVIILVYCLEIDIAVIAIVVLLGLF